MTAYIIVLMGIGRSTRKLICSACFTLWYKLLKFKRKVVKETVVDEDGNATIKTRISIGDPPNVTFREGMVMDQVNTTKPQSYIISTPIPATTYIDSVYPSKYSPLVFVARFTPKYYMCIGYF